MALIWYGIEFFTHRHSCALLKWPIGLKKFVGITFCPANDERGIFGPLRVQEREMPEMLSLLNETYVKSKLNDMFTNSRAIVVVIVVVAHIDKVWPCVLYTSQRQTHCIWIEFLNKHKHRVVSSLLFPLSLCIRPFRLHWIFGMGECTTWHFSLPSSARVRTNSNAAQYHDAWWQIKCADSLSTEEIKKKLNEKTPRENRNNFVFICLARERLKFSKRNDINSRDSRQADVCCVYGSRQKEVEDDDVVETPNETSRKIKRKMLLTFFLVLLRSDFVTLIQSTAKKVLPRDAATRILSHDSTTAQVSPVDRNNEIIIMMGFHQKNKENKYSPLCVCAYGRGLPSPLVCDRHLWKMIYSKLCWRRTHPHNSFKLMRMAQI